MITITCDMCGEKLDTEQVELELSYDGGITLGDVFANKHRNLCPKCATRLVNWIDSQLEK